MPRAVSFAAGGLAVLALAGAAAAGTLSDPGCGVTAFPARPDAVVYRLPHTFVRAGSDSVWTRGGAWRRGADYLLDPLRGELRVLRQPAPGETLWIAACWLLAPPPLELELQRYRAARPAAPESAAAPPGSGAPAAARPVTSHSPFAAPAGTALSVTGNKTVAVEFGSSQDAFLRQSLDLAVSGTLAPGVQLTGVLSDRNLPLTAAGSTQDLQALDRVLIELNAPRGSVALGDVPLVLAQGEFARLERRVQGVRGEWSQGSFRGTVAAAGAQGEYFRVQFYGVEGRQGPYLLTDRDGNTGISVVAGSEVVTVDGVRMTRGEGADYALDYQRGRVTFTNRRPITATSRITVDYQFALNRYRRNLALASGRWERGRLHLFTEAVTESDDRGRPLDLALDAADRLVLAAAGDSAARAIGPGVTAGVGDYDTVRVASGLVFAYAGPDSGHFSVRFARLGTGLGDYADSTMISGRTAYRYVGPGAGAFRVGRALPLPESHLLWSLGGGGRLGALAFELEGAASKRDLNTFSSLDDRHHVGGAGRAALSLEGGLPGLLGRGGLALSARAVGERFAPFSRLERPFAEQDWGLPAGGGLEHARRVELTGFVRPRAGGELRGGAGRLAAPGGFGAWRRTLEWTMDRTLATRARWERADATQRGVRFSTGGRERLSAEARLRLRWLEPAVRAESDARRSPADSGRVGDRFREGGVELASPRALAWHAVAGLSLRRDARMTAGGFVDQSQVRTIRLALETPANARLGAALQLQRRELRPLADPRRSRGDLASVRLRGEDAGRGLKALVHLEVTSEGENRRVRQVVFVGPGRGGYDATGNFVGVGDYNLVLIVSQDLEKIARAATSARFEWQAAGPERWRGTRAAFDFETETRRRGELELRDPAIAPDAALGDAALARGMVLQRLEGEIAPDSRVAALRLRAERRVTADRLYENFAQTLDDRSLSARWRARPGNTVTTEIEGRARRQVAVQALAGAAGFRRTLLEQAGAARLAWTPDARLRAVAALDAAWSRPTGQPDLTRVVTLGPDLGVALGARGRVEVSARRAFLSGPPAVGLLPSAEPAGAPRWEGTTRLDYRVRESTTAGVSFNVRERPGRAALTTGRAELRAFF